MSGKTYFFTDSNRISFLRKSLLATLFILAWLNVFSQIPQCGPYAKFYSKDSINVTTFGASTVNGYPDLDGFQLPLRKSLERCYVQQVITFNNYGVNGQTTSEGLLRFERDIAGKTGFLLILMGANDAVYIADKRMNINTTISNMQKMISIAKSKNLDVIIGSIQYFREMTGNSFFARSIRSRNAIIDQINAAYKTLSVQNTIGFADINAVLGKNPAFYADDIHLNTRGYRVMALSWFDAINKEILYNFLEPGITQVYPNPAGEITKLGISLPNTSRVLIRVFNMKGNLMATPLDDFLNSGYYEKELNVSNLPNGMYAIQVNILGKSYVKKLLVSR